MLSSQSHKHKHTNELQILQRQERMFSETNCADKFTDSPQHQDQMPKRFPDDMHGGP